MIELRVRPEAELDAFEAALWYEGERIGLGGAFLETMRGVFGRIASMPMQFPLVSADVRRAIMDRFPFGVFFVVDGSLATVIAVMHLHREPTTWERRR
jgi:hypothetical protein